MPQPPLALSLNKHTFPLDKHTLPPHKYTFPLQNICSHAWRGDVARVEERQHGSYRCLSRRVASGEATRDRKMSPQSRISPDNNVNQDRQHGWGVICTARARGRDSATGPLALSLKTHTFPLDTYTILLHKYTFPPHKYTFPCPTGGIDAGCRRT